MTEPVNLELAQLARLDFDDADGGGALPPGGAEAGAAGEPGTAALDAAVSALALGILRTMRTLIARRLDRVPSRGVTPQPGQAGMHAVLSAAQLTGERVQYR